MFTGDSQDEVLLGMPRDLSHLTEEDVVRASSPYQSKIGGKPMWLSSEVNTKGGVIAPATCSNCSTRMLFVMQIYAPTERLERALYFFCCPSACASENHGWIILRDQHLKKTSKEEFQHNNNGHNNRDPYVAVPKTVATTHLKTDWSTICNSSTPPSSTSKFAWCDEDNDEDEDCDLSTLAALINTRDESLKGVSSSSANNPKLNTIQPIEKSSDSNFLHDTGRTLKEKEENATKTDIDIRQSDHSEIPHVTLLAEIFESEYFLESRAASQSSHIDTLLQKYISDAIAEGEEDPSVISLLLEEQQRKKTKEIDFKKKNIEYEDSDDDYEDQDDKEFNNNIRQLKGAIKTRTLQKNAEKKNGVGAHPKNECRKRVKSELYFQKRFSLAPSQVMRYAYGGSPLWCFLPAPSIDNIPICNSCCAPRVFELQLMPTLLSYIEGALDVDNCTAPPSQLGGIENNPFHFSSGFDFGVIAIWSCPNSCEGCRYEIPIVQPSADTI